MRIQRTFFFLRIQFFTFAVERKVVVGSVGTMIETMTEGDIIAEVTDGHSPKLLISVDF